MRFGRARLLIVLAAMLAAGCSLVSGFFISGEKPGSRLLTLQVIAEPLANQNSATALDIVYVYDASAIDLLPKTGPAWFEQKPALLNGFRHSFGVVSLQIPPSQMTQPSLPLRPAYRIVAYANYLAGDGQRPQSLTEFQIAELRLKPATIELKGR